MRMHLTFLQTMDTFKHAPYQQFYHTCLIACIRADCHVMRWAGWRWCCWCRLPSQKVWGGVSTFVSVKQLGIYDGARWPPPSQLLFEPKSNQTVSTAMLQHKIQNWTQRNVKLQHKVTEWRNLSVFASLFSSLHRYLSLSPSLCLSLTPPPLTFQHHPLLLPPDKASIVSQMLFNMESLSLCPSYRAIHMAKWGYLPPFASPRCVQ